MDSISTAPLWEPSDDARSKCRLGRFFDRLEENHGVSLPSHEDAWRWSIDHLDEFWVEIVDEFGIQFDDKPTAVMTSRDLPGARWFPGATLNYAERVLAAPGLPEDTPAVRSISQSRPPVLLTIGDLRRQVASCRAASDRPMQLPGRPRVPLASSRYPLPAMSGFSILVSAPVLTKNSQARPRASSTRCFQTMAKPRTATQPAKTSQWVSARVWPSSEAMASETWW